MAACVLSLFAIRGSEATDTDMHSTNRSAWQALALHAEEIRNSHLRDLFAGDQQRFARLSLRDDGDLLLDFSKQRIEQRTLQLLFELAREADVESWRERMFSGDLINTTEERAALTQRNVQRGAV